MKDQLTFVGVTDQLVSIGVSLGAVAAAFGVRAETVSRWRREGGEFPPPPDWREVLAALAERKGENLVTLARELRESAPHAQASSDRRRA